MYNLKHNNYNLKPKNSSIYTPPAVSQFIFELVSSHIRDWRSKQNENTIRILEKGVIQ